MHIISVQNGYIMEKVTKDDYLMVPTPHTIPWIGMKWGSGGDLPIMQLTGCIRCMLSSMYQGPHNFLQCLLREDEFVYCIACHVIVKLPQYALSGWTVISARGRILT